MGAACFKDNSSSGVARRDRRRQRRRRGSASPVSEDDGYQQANRMVETVDTPSDTTGDESGNHNRNGFNANSNSRRGQSNRFNLPANLESMSVANIRESCSIDLHVKQTLKGVNNLHEISTREPPLCMLRLHDVAECENGWLAVLLSLVECVPIDEPVGSAVIMIVIDDCSLPNKVTINRLIKYLNLGNKTVAKLNGSNGNKWRNVCTVLGCVADKLAGPNAEAVLSQDVSEFLFSCIEPKVNYETTLHALVAIEKIAKTAKNKKMFEKQQISNQLARLESFFSSKDYMAQQVGFCAQWLLDNIFLKPDRPFTYELVVGKLQSSLDKVPVPAVTELDASSTASAVSPIPTANAAMLNDSDVSEYLKISPDGLTARCDAYSFESVRSTLHVNSGAWYYEVQVVTPGIMQIGWATKNSRFSNHDGFGVGDDELSCAYDGCRQFIWHNAATTRHTHKPWKMGDMVGFLIDIDNEELVFSLNGSELHPENEIFNFAKSGFYAAASFMSFQQCIFNFGATPFVYPPDVKRRPNVKGLIEACFLFGNNDTNDSSSFATCILPRHIKQKRMLEEMEKEDEKKIVNVGQGDKGTQSNQMSMLCFICCTNVADTLMLPCNHSDVCMTCALQLEQCAVCRTPIESRQINMGATANSVAPSGDTMGSETAAGIFLSDVPQMVSVE